MRRLQLPSLIIVIVLLALITGCTTSGQPPQATATLGAVMPTLTSAVVVTATSPIADAPTATQAPPPTNTLPPPATNTAPAPAATATTAPVTTTTYAVIRVPAGEKLAVHANAGSNSAVTGTLAADAANLSATGKLETVGDQRWREISDPQGVSGWVDDAFLTETVTPDAFCADPRAQALIDSLVKAIREKDGKQLEALVSPLHGLTVEFIRAGTQANYTPEEARWVFDSTYQMVWGLHPGSGAEVKGSFHELVLPKLEDVLLAASMQRSCHALVMGGTTYDAKLPDGYQNINFFNLHRPGAAGDELNWRTWVVGVDYVDGKPYLFSLNHFEWEP